MGRREGGREGGGGGREEAWRWFKEKMGRPDDRNNTRVCAAVLL